MSEIKNQRKIKTRSFARLQGRQGKRLNDGGKRDRRKKAGMKKRGSGGASYVDKSGLKRGKGKKGGGGGKKGGKPITL